MVMTLHCRGTQNALSGFRQQQLQPTTSTDAGRGIPSPISSRRGNHGRWSPSRVILGMSSRRGDAVGEDVEEQVDGVSATPDGSTDVDATATATAAVGEAWQSRKIANKGIGWVSLATVFATQVAFVGIFFWLASPGIRESCDIKVPMSFIRSKNTFNSCTRSSSFVKGGASTVSYVNNSIKTAYSSNGPEKKCWRMHAFFFFVYIPYRTTVGARLFFFSVLSSTIIKQNSFV